MGRGSRVVGRGARGSRRSRGFSRYPYNSLEPCRVSFCSPDARVAILRWLNSLKQTRRGLCTNAPYHQTSDDSIKSVHCPWPLAVRYCFALNSTAKRSDEYRGWLICGKNILPIIVTIITGFSDARCKRPRICVW